MIVSAHESYPLRPVLHTLRNSGELLGNTVRSFDSPALRSIATRLALGYPPVLATHLSLLPAPLSVARPLFFSRVSAGRARDRCHMIRDYLLANTELFQAIPQYERTS